MRLKGNTEKDSEYMSILIPNLQPVKPKKMSRQLKIPNCKLGVIYSTITSSQLKELHYINSISINMF